MFRNALIGHYQSEHVLALIQSLALYEFYQAQIDKCDEQIQQVLARLNVDKPVPEEALPKPRHRTKQPNAINFDVHSLLCQLVGIDLTQIHGIGPFLARYLTAECGTEYEQMANRQTFHLLASIVGRLQNEWR